MAREHDVVVLPRHKDAVVLYHRYMLENTRVGAPTPPFPPTREQTQNKMGVSDLQVKGGKRETRHAAEYPL